MTTTLKTSDFFYQLPEELIAQTPAEPRDSARMLCYHQTGGIIEHKVFSDIYDMLREGDVLVVNNTKVILARLFAKDAKGREYETLLLKRLDYTHWEAIMRPARKAKIGSTLTVSDELSFKVESIIDNGVRIIDFEFDGVFEDILDRVGNVPLPPYITKKLEDKTQYNTVYARYDGSAAAPTAGLHFTQELLDRLTQKGVRIAEVLLHVGLGTFRPVKCDNITEHKMHSEHYEISEESANIINTAVKNNCRIIAVGTTSVRTLESAANPDGTVRAEVGDTEIFIYPGYKFRVVKNLITNFHLPESTLLMLISALVGREEILRVYQNAVENQYRFFSFGDATYFITEE